MNGEIMNGRFKKKKRSKRKRILLDINIFIINT